jgi:hypothetical protein
MQTILCVSCRGSGSVRDAIGDDDRRLAEFGLVVAEERRAGRAPGWSKLRSTRPDRDGAVNVRWQGNANLLVCRIVTRGKGDPSLLAGDLTAYLLRWHRRRIQVITTLVG